MPRKCKLHDGFGTRRPLVRRTAQANIARVGAVDNAKIARRALGRFAGPHDASARSIAPGRSWRRGDHRPPGKLESLPGLDSQVVSLSKLKHGVASPVAPLNTTRRLPVCGNRTNKWHGLSGAALEPAELHGADADSIDDNGKWREPADRSRLGLRCGGPKDWPRNGAQGSGVQRRDRYWWAAIADRWGDSSMNYG